MSACAESLAQRPRCLSIFASLVLHTLHSRMVAQQHYQRLKHLYAADPADSLTGPVEISYGFAELVGIVEGPASAPALNRMPHQELLSDATSLAAGSVEKEGQLSMERFDLTVTQPEYEGPVRAAAEVVLAEPPRYHVRATLFGDDGEELAEALAFFEPSGTELPPDPDPGADAERAPTPPPAPFMPVEMTPYGVLCLN